MEELTKLQAEAEACVFPTHPAQFCSLNTKITHLDLLADRVLVPVWTPQADAGRTIAAPREGEGCNN